MQRYEIKLRSAVVKLNAYTSYTYGYNIYLSLFLFLSAYEQRDDAIIVAIVGSSW